jgi:hypothetical protein
LLAQIYELDKIYWLQQKSTLFRLILNATWLGKKAAGILFGRSASFVMPRLRRQWDAKLS